MLLYLSITKKKNEKSLHTKICVCHILNVSWSWLCVNNKGSLREVVSDLFLFYIWCLKMVGCLYIVILTRLCKFSRWDYLFAITIWIFYRIIFSLEIFLRFANFFPAFVTLYECVLICEKKKTFKKNVRKSRINIHILEPYGISFWLKGKDNY